MRRNGFLEMDLSRQLRMLTFDSQSIYLWHLINRYLASMNWIHFKQNLSCLTQHLQDLQDDSKMTLSIHAMGRPTVGSASTWVAQRTKQLSGRLEMSASISMGMRMRCIKDGPGMGPKSAQEYKKYIKRFCFFFASWSPPANHAMYLRETWHKVAYSLVVLGCIALCRRKLLDTAPAMCGLLVARRCPWNFFYHMAWAELPKSQLKDFMIPDGYSKVWRDHLWIHFPDCDGKYIIVQHMFSISVGFYGHQSAGSEKHRKTV